MTRSKLATYRLEYDHRRRLGSSPLVAFFLACAWTLRRYNSRPVAYISGPMRGIKDFNFPAFHRAAAYLRQQHGWWVLNPAEMGDVAGWGWPDYMRRDIVAVSTADVVVLLDGWEGSKGAGEELHAGKVFGCSVYYLHEEFADDTYPRYALTQVPPEPELGKLDVTFTIETKDKFGNLLAAPATARRIAARAIESLKTVHDASFPTEGQTGEPETIFYQVTGGVIHSSDATIDQGFSTGVEGLDYHESAYSKLAGGTDGA